MSHRRMFSPTIVESDAFLEMPISSQALYFHLCMFSDDDGFVNPKRIMRMIGVSEDDLKVLLSKRFLLSFESGVVVVKHWLIHNLIRADLYKETTYISEKNTLGLNENGAYTELRDGVGQLKKIEIPKWLQIRRKDERYANGTQSALRLGKDRLGKDSKDTSSFDDFWSVYPKKSEKKKAEKKWETLKQETRLIILQDIPKRKLGRKWIEGFIENPTTYLNGERWNDEIELGKSSSLEVFKM